MYNPDHNNLCYELLNGDILFTINSNKFCYFNIKVFIIQTIIEEETNKNIIRFNQLNDKNYFYFFMNNIFVEFNINNGKMKEMFSSKYDKKESIKLGEYYINNSFKSITIIDENNKTLYSKSLIDKCSILAIDEKEKIFASLAFYQPYYSMYINVFKITKYKK